MKNTKPKVDSLSNSIEKGKITVAINLHPKHPKILILFATLILIVGFLFSFIPSPAAGQEENEITKTEDVFTLHAETTTFTPTDPPTFTFTEQENTFTQITRTLGNVFGPDYSLSEKTIVSLTSQTEPTTAEVTEPK